MKQSSNKKLGKDKYYNTQRGKKDDNFFFILPGLFVSPKKILYWDTEMFSIFLGWGKYFIQYNIFKSIQNTNVEIDKKLMLDLFNILKKENYYLNTDDFTIKDIIGYLEKNTHIIKIVKNANLEHHYIQTIIVNLLKNQPFIIQKNKTI